MKSKYSYWKIPVVLLFIGIICFAINLQSEHWVSFAKGFLFFSDLSDEQQLMLIRKMSFYSVSVLSVLFLVIRNRMSNIALITLMIIYTLLVFPFSYVDDPTQTF